MPRETSSAFRQPAARPARVPGRVSGAEIISSRDNRWLKTFRAALHDGFLSTENLIGLEGPHLVEEALRSELEIEACLVSPAGEKILNGWPQEWQRSLSVLKTTERLFAGVAGTEHPQGIAALVRPREFSFDDLLRGDVPLVIALIGVQDPGNVGTVVRSAEAFGATGCVATRGTADPWSPKALRASAGSALRMPLLRGIAPPVALAQFRVASLNILAATSDPSAPQMPSSGLLREPCAILIGAEGSGLPPEIERSADALFAIPMVRDVESLNAGVAASVILYEAARQRAGQGLP
ncbi:MAG: RNA methyltransferase [Candidatus Acidiferrales bacterium]